MHWFFGKSESISIIKFMLIVHPALHRWLPSKKLSSSALHSRLSPFSNSSWPEMHDGISIRAASKSTVSLWEILRCQFHNQSNCEKLNIFFVGCQSWIWQELWFFKATCRLSRSPRCTGKGNSWQFLNSYRRGISARSCAGFWADKHERCRAPGMRITDIS